MKCRVLFRNESVKHKSIGVIVIRECILERELSEKYNRKIVYSDGQFIDYKTGCLIPYSKDELQQAYYQRRVEDVDFKEIEKLRFIERTTNRKENIRLKKYEKQSKEIWSDEDEKTL